MAKSFVEMTTDGVFNKQGFHNFHKNDSIRHVNTKATYVIVDYSKEDTEVIHDETNNTVTFIKTA